MVAIKAGRGPVLAGSPVADRQIHRDAEEPCVERRFALEAGDALHGADECLLHQIGGILRMADHPQHRHVEPVLVAMDKLLHRGPVAPAKLAQRLLIGKRQRSAAGIDGTILRRGSARRAFPLRGAACRYLMPADDPPVHFL